MTGRRRGGPPIPAGVDHIVADGDCALSLAVRAGVPISAIWDHPNNAFLRQKRSDPAALVRGDRLFIPEPRTRSEDRVVNQRHEFQREQSVKVRLRLIEYDHLLTNTRCALTVDGKVQQKTSDGRGRLEFSVPASALSAQLVVFCKEREIRYELTIGSLDDHTTVRGACQRLRNLNYTDLDPVSEPTPWFINLLHRFQADKGLPRSDELDDKTATTLRDWHGS